MNHLRLLFAAVAAAGAFAATPASADPGTPVCLEGDPAARVCVVVHLTPVPCVTGGGHVLDKYFLISPCPH